MEVIDYYDCIICYVICVAKEIVIDDGVHTCENCNKQCENPIERFKVHVKMKDMTNDIIIITPHLLSRKVRNRV